MLSRHELCASALNHWRHCTVPSGWVIYVHGSSYMELLFPSTAQPDEQGQTPFYVRYLVEEPDEILETATSEQTQGTTSNTSSAQ